MIEEEERYPMIFNVEGARNRFGGYNLPMIQWDETGPNYIMMPVHPGGTSQAPNSHSERGVSPVRGNESPVLPFGDD